MRIAIALAITLVAGGMSPVLAASSEPAATAPLRHHHHHHTHHHPTHRAERSAPVVVTPAPEAVAPQTPSLRPYPPGEGDTDGLSRDQEDCDKGCIGGNPN